MTDKKEELTMEKSCETCRWLFGSYPRHCESCSRRAHTDNWEPNLPTKTKDLIWQEAYEAWNDGWEVATDSDDRWTISFEKSEKKQWSILDIIQVRYHLTGKRW